MADLQVLTLDYSGSAFPVNWTGNGGLTWQWPPGDIPVSGFSIQSLASDGATWTDIVPLTTATSYPAQELLALLDPGGPTRQMVRAVSHTAFGPVASLPIVVYPDGGFQPGVSLGLPRPNPSRDQVSVTLEIPEGSSGALKIFDLRGRLMSDRIYPAGRHLISWDGRDRHGTQAAAGTYIFRLEGSGQVIKRKVVLLH